MKAVGVYLWGHTRDEGCGVYLGGHTRDEGCGVYLQGHNTGVGHPSCLVDTHTPPARMWPVEHSNDRWLRTVLCLLGTESV